jgi:hypothetical protein
MPDVILSESSGHFADWTKKFVARQPQGRVVLFEPDNQTPAEAANRMIDAIKQAGTGGTLIVSVGHGSTSTSGNTGEGTCELAPKGAFKIVGRNGANGFVDVFYDAPTGPTGQSQLDFDLKNNPNSSRLANFRVYKSICDQFKATKLLRVILLTCNVGRSEEFLRKIANDWGTVVFAYTKQVSCTRITLTAGRQISNRFFMHLHGENVPFPTAEQDVIAQEEIPLRPNQTVRIGPPLPKP